MDLQLQSDRSDVSLKDRMEESEPVDEKDSKDYGSIRVQCKPNRIMGRVELKESTGSELFALLSQFRC